MNDLEPKSQATIASWIVSLAISVACCAVLFVIFAEYLMDIKKNISVENERLEQMSIHEEQLLVEIRALHHVTGNQLAVVPAPVPAASAPISLGTSVTTPASSAPPLAPTQAPAATAVAPTATTPPSPQAPVPPPSAPAAVIPEQVQPPAPPAEAPAMPPVSVPALPPAKP